MIKFIQIISLVVAFLISMNCSAKTIRILLMDSGVDKELLLKRGVKICETGHFDAILNRPTLSKDTIGHGTNMALLIHSKAKEANYCIVSYKMFDGEHNNIDLIFRQAYTYLLKTTKVLPELKPDVINMSFSGRYYNWFEEESIRQLNRRGILAFIASGNKGQNLDTTCDVYPACYKDLPLSYVVGSKGLDGLKTGHSNYGSIVKIWDDAEFFEGISPFSIGTSNATARVTGTYAKFLSDKFNGK